VKEVVSIRLSADVRRALTQEARHLGVPLRTLLRQIAEERALETRRRHIKSQSAALVKRLREKGRGTDFFEDWGTPDASIDAE